MNFTSLTFWVFFTLVFLTYWLVRERGWQNALLLFASYIFYAWLSPWYAVLLGASTLADFYFARQMKQQRDKARTYLVLSLILNLGVLAFFKYYNFFNTQVAETLTRKGIENDAAREGGYRFLTTGDTGRFRELGQRFLQLPLEGVGRVEIAELEAAAA